jgi:hypothetical protein
LSSSGIVSRSTRYLRSRSSAWARISSGTGRALRLAACGIRAVHARILSRLVNIWAAIACRATRAACRIRRREATGCARRRHRVARCRAGIPSGTTPASSVAEERVRARRTSDRSRECAHRARRTLCTAECRRCRRIVSWSTSGRTRVGGRTLVARRAGSAGCAPRKCVLRRGAISGRRSRSCARRSGCAESASQRAAKRVIPLVACDRERATVRTRETSGTSSASSVGQHRIFSGCTSNRCAGGIRRA